jgi:hypothetical protein
VLTPEAMDEELKKGSTRVLPYKELRVYLERSLSRLGWRRDPMTGGKDSARR